MLLTMRTLRQDPVIWAIAAATLALHVATSGGYDFFRNELYFIVCGRHPAFGYADQPPLVPLIAAATQAFGLNLTLLRLPASLAAAALVPITASLARLLGGNTLAAIVAALAVSLSPALAALTSITTTTTFEPLCWTLTAYFLARAVVRTEPRALFWAGITAGISLQAKYGIVFWLAGLLPALLAQLTLSGTARGLLPSRPAVAGALAATAIALPSLVWQALHGFPFVQVMANHAATHAIFTGTPLQYEIGQALANNPVLAPLWLGGLIAPFVMTALKPARFIAGGYVITAALTIGLGGKDYYLFPAYPALFAIGAAALGRVPAWLGGTWMALAALAAAPIVPVILPVLSPPALFHMLETHPELRPAPDERAAIGAPLTQVFSDEMGWRELEQKVAAVYQALPPDQRAHATIVASNYGEAAALDVFGAADHLPPAISGQDQYYFWGPGNPDGSVIIHVGGRIKLGDISIDPAERWRRHCAALDTAATFGVPLAMPYERDEPILLCRGLNYPLAEYWPRFKRM